MENTKTHGGKRKGAGRKAMPASQKKILIGTYHHPKDIQLIGGNEVARNLACTAIERKVKAIKKT